MANNKSFDAFIPLMQLVSCVYYAWHINQSIISDLLLALSQTQVPVFCGERCVFPQKIVARNDITAVPKKNPILYRFGFLDIDRPSVHILNNIITYLVSF